MAAADDSMLYLISNLVSCTSDPSKGKRESDKVQSDPLDALVDRVSRKFAHVHIDQGHGDPAGGEVDVFDVRHLLPYHRDSILAALMSQNPSYHYHAIVQLRRYLSVGW